MKRDTVTLSQFLKKEKRKLENEIKYLEQERVRDYLRINSMYDFNKFRREQHKKNSKLWPLQEHSGDFSQSFDWYMKNPC
jgi:hypothetical protein